MKIAILNDTHCGIRNSSDIFMEYQEKFYRDVFFPYLNDNEIKRVLHLGCLLYTSPSPRDATLSRMPSSA